MYPYKNFLFLSVSVLNTVWWTYLVRACVYLTCYSTTGHFEAKTTTKRSQKYINLQNKKDEDTALIEFVSYLMKSESLHEWKPVSSVLHCLGISSWLLTHCACSKWQTFGWRDYSTWELQPGTFSALRVRWLHAGIYSAAVAIYTEESRASASESSSAGVQKAPGRALAGLWPRADSVLRERTHVTLRYLSSTTFPVR